MTSGVQGRTVVVAGATSESGAFVTDALLADGATVIAVGSNSERLDAFVAEHDGAIARSCDLSDAAAVGELAAWVAAEHGGTDGLIHLVGGWRGGGSIPGQKDEDWEVLERSFRTLRNTSRAFYPQLVASPAGRLAIVSSTSVANPRAGGASYASAKAAGDAWTRAVAQGFGKDAPASAAAVIFVVTALAGLEQELAERVLGLWEVPARELNGQRAELVAVEN